MDSMEIVRSSLHVQLLHLLMLRNMALGEYGVELVKLPDVIGQTERPWWQPLISLINFVLLGYCLKTYFGWDRDKTGSLRRVTFNILLPLYVLRNMWVARIDSSMYGIAKASLVIHLLQAVFWTFLFKNVKDRCMRGWLSMISQGCLTSFFYANLSSHAPFGQQAVAVCLLFDIGGNTPCAQGLLWGLAAYFAPDKIKGSNSSTFETAFSSPLLTYGRLHRIPSELPLSEASHGVGYLTRLKNREMESVEEETMELASLLDEGSYPAIVQNRKPILGIIGAVVFQPILPAFGMGLMMSIYNVGCPVGLDYALEGLGLLFKPCLYFLIGLYSEVILNALQLRIVVTVLGLRYLFAGSVALMMWLWLPFGDLERTTMALTLLSPVSTMTMYLAAEYNYPTQYVSMSATLTTISVFISFAIQEAVIRSF